MKKIPTDDKTPYSNSNMHCVTSSHGSKKSIIFYFVFFYLFESVV